MCHSSVIIAGVALGRERRPARASVGSGRLEAIGLRTLVLAGVHGEIYKKWPSVCAIEGFVEMWVVW